MSASSSLFLEQTISIKVSSSVPSPCMKKPKLGETCCSVCSSNSSSQLSEWVFSGTFRYPASHVYLVFSVTLTFMEALSSEASYWAVLFIRPKIRASREPDSAPFRALTRSWHNHRHRVKNHFRNDHLYKSKKFRICCISHCLFCLSVSLIFPSTFRVKVLFLAHDLKQYDVSCWLDYHHDCFTSFGFTSGSKWTVVCGLQIYACLVCVQLFSCHYRNLHFIYDNNNIPFIKTRFKKWSLCWWLLLSTKSLSVHEKPWR